MSDPVPPQGAAKEITNYYTGQKWILVYRDGGWKYVAKKIISSK